MLFRLVKKWKQSKCDHHDHIVEPIGVQAYGINAPVDFICRECDLKMMILVPMFIHAKMSAEVKASHKKGEKFEPHMDDYLAAPKYGGSRKERLLKETIFENLNNAVANGYPPATDMTMLDIAHQMIEHGALEEDADMERCQKFIRDWFIEDKRKQMEQ